MYLYKYASKMTTCLVLAMLSCVALPLAAAPGDGDIPDLTKGEAPPENARHDWNLGATGARGWMYSNRMETTDARQILITSVSELSPADNILDRGDVILGVAGERFTTDPRLAISSALTQAETAEGNGQLSLIRWRNGTTDTVTLDLPVLGTYSETAPYNCLKSARILELGCAQLAEDIASPSYRPNAIVRSLNGLALLASGNDAYLPLIEREARWAAEFSANSMQVWWYGYTIAFLSEYVIRTGDEAVIPGLRRMTMEAATGQSAVGSWGHGFANDQGQLYGYGMMNAPGVPLTTALVLAREAGIDDPALDLAIDRSVTLLRFYLGKGSIPYGDHDPWIQNHDDNGKNGMAAVLFNLLGDEEATTYFSRMSVACHGAERDTGHSGNFLNLLWALPGVAQSGPNATGAWMQAYGANYFDLAREWDGSFIHQGPPHDNPDSFNRWDATGAYLLAYAIPNNNLYLTSGVRRSAPRIDVGTAQSLIEDGRGWSNNNRHSYYDALSDEELLIRLSSWSPVVRERSAMALGRRNAPVLDQVIAMLDSDDLYTRYGACRGIKFLRGNRAAAIPKLLEAFNSDDLWLRVLAAEALAGVGDPARVAIPQVLQRLTEYDQANDPRGMEQRYLCFALFNRRGGLMGQSLDGVDRAALMAAVRAGLQNQDGRARGALASVYQNLSFQEIRPLLPAIREAIIERPPSGIMFSNEIRMAGLELLTRHHVDEGIELLVYYAEHQRPHASEHRLPEIMQMLRTYGVHAQRVIPALEVLAADFQDGEENFPLRLSQGKAQNVRETIEFLRQTTDRPELISIDE